MLDIHHSSEMMTEVLKLLEKYDLKVFAERFLPDEINTEDKKFINTNN